MASDCKPLPHDTIFDILSRLRLRDLCRNRCVSKSWLALISDPLFQQHHRRICEKNPLLLVTTIDNTSSGNKITHSLLDKESKAVDHVAQLTLNQDLLLTSPITAVAMDLVCTYDSFSTASHDVYICNPMMKSWIHLSGTSLPPDVEICYRNVAFGYITPTSSYKLFRVFEILIPLDHHGDLKFEVLTLGSNHWRAVEGPPRDVLIYHYSADMSTTINGSVYLLWDGLSHRGNVIITVFDLKEETWSFVPIPFDHHDDLTCKWSLMEIGGQLCLAHRCSTTVGHWLELCLLKGLHENMPIWEKGRRIDISIGARWHYPLAIEEETGRILLQTKTYDRLLWMLWYDPDNQAVEEIFSGIKNSRPAST